MSGVEGTVNVKMIFDSFTTVHEMLLLTIKTPETITPTFVRLVRSVVGMKPVPVSTAVKVLPEAAVGRLPGDMPVNKAPGDCTVILKVTTVVEIGLPHDNVTVPVSTSPGCDAASTVGSKVTPIWVPKL